MFEMTFPYIYKKLKGNVLLWTIFDGCVNDSIVMLDMVIQYYFISAALTRMFNTHTLNFVTVLGTGDW